MRTALPAIASILSPLLLGGCMTDAATRLAYDIEAGADRVGRADGARHTVVHRTPSSSDECIGPYKVQFDAVGLIVFWCKDDSGQTIVSSHSTSYHRRFVVTPETHILDKSAGETLLIDLERRGDRIVVAGLK